MNLTMTNIANEMVVNNENSFNDENTLLFRKLCFTEKEIQNIEESTRRQSQDSASNERQRGQLTAWKHHEFYFKINTLSKIRSSTHPTTTFNCSIVFPDDKLKDLEPVKWRRDNETNALKVFMEQWPIG